MKSEDLFEALTDIDDDLIYKAKAAQLKETKTEEEYAEPTFITVTKRQFPWKAAASAAMAVIVAVSAGAAVLQNGYISSPSQQDGNISLPLQHGDADIVLKSAEYPPEAKYVYDGDFFDLPLVIAGEIDRKGYDLYDPMERDSDLVVYGTFTDDAHQTFDPEYSSDIFNPAENLYSYNKFRIDKVIKSDGSVREGDEIIIAQEYAVYDSQLMTFSGLTPMIKGDEWFYCLTKSGDSNTCYYAAGDTDGRYSSLDAPPNHDNTSSFDLIGIFANNDYKQNIHELVYERYLNENFIPYVRHLINYLDENPGDMFKSTESFEIPEFPGVYFVWSAYELKAVKGDEETVLYSGMPIWDLHLADLNGDGKREICSTVSIGSGIIDDRIIAADYANNEVYELSDRGNYDYHISVEITEDQNKSREKQALFYVREKYNGYGSTVSESENGILALDIMRKINDEAENEQIIFPSFRSLHSECILDLNSGDNSIGWDDTYAFTIPEFPEAEFKWISSEKLEVSANGKNITLYSGNPIWSIYLSDLNGDGKREICSDISVGYETIDHRIAVFDYKNGEHYELSDSGNYDYRIDRVKTLLSSELGGLYYSKLFSNGEIAESNILSLDMMKKIATVVIDRGNIDASTYEIPAEGAAVAENSSLEQAYVSGNEAKDRTFDPKNFEIYEQFGMNYVSEKKGLFYNGKKVRWFEDYYPIDEDGNQAGIDYINETGVVDVYAVRDFSNLTRNPDGSFDPSGKLIGLKEFSEEEFAARDINAILTDEEVTHIANTYDDSTVVETDSGAVDSVFDNQIVADFDNQIGAEATTNVLSEEEKIKAREEHLKMEEEYKPFGVTYDEKEDQWYFNGEKVRYFRDILTSNGESLSSGKFHGSMRTMSGTGTVDIYTVRDFGEPDKDGVGKLTEIKAFEDGEINSDAVLTEN